MNLNKIGPPNIIYTVFSAIFGIALCYLFWRFFNYHYHLITYPYPLEYREGSEILPTVLWLQGQNPFDISNNPQYTNVYGFFTNLLILPFAKWWGPSILLHRLMPAFFIFASCLLMVVVLRKFRLPIVLSCGAGVMLYPFLLYPNTGTPLAGPPALGMFLFLITFFLPFLFNYSRSSLGISILTGLLAFYTKPYFLLSIPLTALYIFLFKSKKTGMVYGAIFLIAFILSIFIVNSVMNCYFNNTFFVNLNSTQALGGSSVAYAVMQLQFFYHAQKFLFYILGTYFLAQGYLYIKNFKIPSFKDLVSKIKFHELQEPCIKWDMNINLYGLTVTTLTIYFLLGRHQGQYMGYLFQLMSPFFILYVFTCLDKYLLLAAIGIPLILMTLFKLTSVFPQNYHEFDDGWQVVDGLIITHQNIFASPLIDPLLIKYHRPVYDSGQSEYFHLGSERKLLHFQFPLQPQIDRKNEAYWAQIWNMTAQKKFDLIIIFSKYHPFLSDYCLMFYRPVGMVHLGTFHNSDHDDLIVLVPK